MKEYQIKLSFSCSFESKTKIRFFVKKYDKKFNPINFLYSHWDEKYAGFDIILKIDENKILSNELNRLYVMFGLDNKKIEISIEKEAVFKIKNIAKIYEIKILIYEL